MLKKKIQPQEANKRIKGWLVVQGSLAFEKPRALSACCKWGFCKTCKSTGHKKVLRLRPSLMVYLWWFQSLDLHSSVWFNRFLLFAYCQWSKIFPIPLRKGNSSRWEFLAACLWKRTDFEAGLWMVWLEKSQNISFTHIHWSPEAFSFRESSIKMQKSSSVPDRMPEPCWLQPSSRLGV